MIIVREKDRTLILNKDGSIRKIISISEESYFEDQLLEELYENKKCLIDETLSNVV